MANLFEATAAEQIIRNDIFYMEGVCGIGVGNFDDRDATLGQAVIVVVVKGRRDDLLSKIPRVFETVFLGNRLNVPVRIIDHGPITADGVRPASEMRHPEYERWIRPAKTGYSIGKLNEGETGTMSMCIRLNGTAPQKKYILGNAHVLSNNVNGVPAIIVQPRRHDPGSVSIGRLEWVHRLVLPPGLNRLDAAIAVPNNPDDISNLWDDRPLLLDWPFPNNFNPNVALEKVGRTNGRVSGNNIKLMSLLKVNYGGWAGIGETHFQDVLAISSTNGNVVAGPGESGSVWVHNIPVGSSGHVQRKVHAMAIHFAGPDDHKTSYSFPWQRVYEVWPSADGFDEDRIKIKGDM